MYNVAGEIWPSALKLAFSRNLEASEARDALLHAVAKHYASLESINKELFADQSAAAVMEHNLLLAEIVARMDDDMRGIYEGLILGYSFEELAKKHGKPANLLRSKFSKGVKRIARDIRATE